MNRIFIFVSAIIFLACATSCDFESKSFELPKTMASFVDAMLVEDYDACVDFFAIENDLGANFNVDTLKAGLPNLRNKIQENFPGELEYTLMGSSKSLFQSDQEAQPETINAQVQFKNDREFGIFRILLDGKTGKFINLELMQKKYPIPNMVLFWLFGLIALAVPIFNIYVIRRIRKSNLKRKWLKYIAVLFLNAPTFFYSAVSGFGFKLLHFQFLLGIGFSYAGYFNAAITIGLPLGGLYWLSKLSGKKEESTIERDRPAAVDIIDDLDNEDSLDD